MSLRMQPGAQGATACDGRSSRFAFVVKSVLDQTLALTALLVLLPILILISLIIKMTSRGPVLFLQERAGKQGRKFVMYKFRSMSIDAPARKAELIPLNEMSGPVFKMKNDPRVTTFGRFIRKYSFDELPQLFNVLKGDMSLVGPRPLPLEEAHCLDEGLRRRQSVKPGITCLWQVNGRNQIDYEEWMQMDLEYIDRWSLLLDAKILLRTVIVVIQGRGAS